MPERLHLYTIPPHRAFADALAIGLIRRFGGDPLRLARGLGAAAQQPRQAGDPGRVRARERRRAAAAAAGRDRRSRARRGGALSTRPTMRDPVPPAVDPLQRRMILARLIQARRAPGSMRRRRCGWRASWRDARSVAGRGSRAARGCTTLELGRSLSAHWAALAGAVRGRADALARGTGAAGADRSGRAAAAIAGRRVAKRWRAAPPAGLRLRGGHHRHRAGDRAAAARGRGAAARDGGAARARDWDQPTRNGTSLGPHEPDPVTGGASAPSRRIRNSTSSCCSTGWACSRGEFDPWRAASEHDAPPARSRAIASAMAPPELTAELDRRCQAAERRLDGRARARSRDAGRGGAGDRAGAARGAGDARADRGAGHARSRAGPARGGASARAGTSRSTIRRGSRCRCCRRARCCSRWPRRRRRRSRRCRC